MVTPIGPAEAVLDLVGLAGAKGLGPAFEAAWPIRGMRGLTPSPAETPFERQAGEIRPPSVEVLAPAIGPSGPDQLGEGLGQGAEPVLALAQDLLRLLAFADVTLKEIRDRAE